jgi:dipeptidyl aminopeptidase/acylaminoacyl peptidase
MIYFFLVLTTCFSLLLPVQGEDTVPPQIPLQDFFRNPQAAGFSISPDGKYLALLKPWNNRLNIWLEPVEGGEPKRLTSITDRDPAGVAWKGNDIVLFEKDNGGDENFHLYAVGRDGQNERNLTPFPGARVALVDDLEDDPTDVIIQTNQRDKQLFDAYRLNVVTGKVTLIAKNPGNIQEWITDWNGEIRAAITTDGVNRSLLYRKTEQSPWKAILTTNFRETFDVQFFSFDNQHLYGISNIGRDKSAAVELDPETGKEVRVVYENPEVDVSRLSYSRKRKVITLASYNTWKRETVFFDPATEEAYRYLEQKFPNFEVSRTGSDKEENKFVVLLSGDRTRGSYYIYDVKSRDIRKLADLSPWLQADQLAEMKPIEYKSRDGLTIHGYLTLPKGRDPKNLPVVVHPHGGPWSRDEWGFNPEVQFLANRGYAVLQMNFRGSTGYGRKFLEAGFKQWGGTMQDDITDGVNWLVQQGTADPKRLAIYGGSYGGYAVLQALVKTPNLYAAGIDYVGVSNLFTFLNTIPPYWKPELDMFHEMVGDPEKDKDWFQDHSPALNADKIKTPLLVAQGAKDPRVNINESNQIVDALKKRGVPVEYIVKPDEGHGFHNEENRFDFYGAMEKFLSEHLKAEARSKNPEARIEGGKPEA